MTGNASSGGEMWKCANCGAEVDPITTAETDTMTAVKCPKCGDDDEIPQP